MTSELKGLKGYTDGYIFDENENCIGKTYNRDHAKIIADAFERDRNTRAEPDVPELVAVSHEVFYAPTREWRKTVEPEYYRKNGDLVRDLIDKSKAAAMLAAKGEELEQAKEEINAILVRYVREHFFDNKDWQPLGDLIGQITQLDNAITITRDFKNRAEAAEAKLAQINAQKPVAWMHPEAGWTDVSKAEIAVHCKHGIYPKPLYAAPVDQTAEIERLRGLLKRSHAALELDRSGRHQLIKEEISRALGNKSERPSKN